MDRCLAGDREAWESFLRSRGPFLLREIRFALRRLGVPESTDLIQDAVQDLVHGLLRDDAAALRRFRWNCSLDRYLAILAFSRAADVARRRHTERHQESGSAAPSLWEDLASVQDAEPFRALEREEGEARLEKALALLSPRERLALRLHYWEEFSHEALQRMLSLSNDAVRSLLSRARKRLRESLGTFCF